LVLKICMCVDRFGPNRRWQIDTLVKVMCLAGNYVQEETRSQFCQIVGSSPPLQAYVAHKCFYSITDNIGQESLVLCGVWCLGEYGDYLVNGQATGPDNTPLKVAPEEILNLIEQVQKRPGYGGATMATRNTTVLEYTVTALIKLVPKMPAQQERIRQILRRYETHISPELQQRVCEYQELMKPEWNNIRAELLDRVPAMERVRKLDIGDTTGEDATRTRGSVSAGKKKNAA